MKIVSTGKTLTSPEKYQKKREKKKRNIIVYSILVLLFLVGLIFAARLESLQISEIAVVGANVISSDEIKTSIRETLSGRHLWIIPKTNSLIYAEGRVERNLLNKFPRFSVVDVSRSGINTLEVSVTERAPYAMYCSGEAASTEQCYFLDADGFIFDNAPDFSGSVYFIYKLEDPLETPVGTYFTNAGEFKNLNIFIEALRTLGFEPLSLTITNRDAKLSTTEVPNILWRRGDDSDVLYSNLESFLNSDSIIDDESFLSKVDTLDLRTSNRIRWTLK